MADGPLSAARYILPNTYLPAATVAPTARGAPDFAALARPRFRDARSNRVGRDCGCLAPALVSPACGRPRSIKRLNDDSAVGAAPGFCATMITDKTSRSANGSRERRRNFLRLVITSSE